jgi:glyoxylase-like metal-dependent hydrolase (beta-lactamase superfamily II)
MVGIIEEGKFNPNSFLIDGLIYNLPRRISLYVIENHGDRLLVDAGVAASTRKVINKLKEFDLFPVQKLFLTHSHWDHVQGYSKLKKAIPNLKTYASERTIEFLNDAERLARDNMLPIEEITPIKEGETIGLKELELEAIDLHGHSSGSMGLVDWANKTIFTGDAITVQYDKDTYLPAALRTPDYNEHDLINTFEKVKKLKEELNSIALGHIGVWQEDDFKYIVDNAETRYFSIKNSIIRWYHENNSLEYISEKYLEHFSPNTRISRQQYLTELNLVMEMVINTLKSFRIIV